MITVSIPGDRSAQRDTSTSSKLSSGINRFLFFRMALALMVLYKLLALSPYWEAFFSESGYLSREIIELNNSPGVFSWYLWCDWVAVLTNQTQVEASTLLLTSGVVAAFALLTGLLTRMSALFLLLVNVSLTATFSEYSYGVDHLLSSFLAYALFFPLGRTYALDGVISRLFALAGKYRVRGIHQARAILILRIHLCVIYLVGGLTKAGGPTWWNGEAVWKAIHRPGNDLAFFLANELPVRELYLFLGVATLLVEILYPVMIWWRRTRGVWLFLTLGMHLFIGIVLELHLFATLMIVFNLIAFGRFAVKHHSPTPPNLKTIVS